MESIDSHPVVTREEWLRARKQHLADEKALTRQRDALSEQRRALPWVRLDKSYVFEGEHGPVSLSDAFGGHSQLIVQHFMYGPDWEEGCKSCSFWMDNFDGIRVHLSQRDASFVAISNAPIATLLAFRERMGWGTPWLSAYGTRFNYDFHVSFVEDQSDQTYNYAELRSSMTELPGLSVFIRSEAGEIFHTYSCYARGLDILNSAYHCLDMLPKGRNEDAGMSWLRLHDSYD